MMFFDEDAGDLVAMPDDGAAAAETAAVYAVSGSAYPAMISTQYTDYFAGLIQKDPFHDYVLYRQDNYNYVLVYGGSLTLTGTTVSGAGNAVRLYTGSGSSTLSYSDLGYQSVSVNLGSSPAFSNLGHYPSLGGVNRATLGLVALFVVLLLVRFVSGFFGR